MRIDDLPLVGVFALGSPSRPNPIGLSLVELLKIDGRFLTVKGLEYFDGTPVLDIKPYRDEYRAGTYRAPYVNLQP
jgi:tRNA (Thr-GGU) A37 N-methylase